MKNGLLAFSAAILALWSIGTVQAQELSAGQLYEFCQSKDFVVHGACRFYVLGAVQGMSLGNGSAIVRGQLVEKEKTIFCMPDNVPQSEMVSVFVRRAETLFRVYPQDKEMPAISALIGIMHKQFPCPPS
jgi:hypothetical protein